MSTKILRIDSSIFGDQGVSQQLTQALVEQLGRVHGDISITHRDLAKEPLPHFSAEVIGSLSMEQGARTSEQQALVDLADQLINELMNADVLVLAAPMYNFGIPSTLKAWIDFVARAGVTFRYTETGPEGLVKDKTAYIVTTRGGIYRERASDLQVPYLKTYLGFLGIEDVHVVYAEGINMGRAARSVAEALADIRQTIAA